MTTTTPSIYPSAARKAAQSTRSSLLLLAVCIIGTILHHAGHRDTIRWGLVGADRVSGSAGLTTPPVSIPSPRRGDCLLRLSDARGVRLYSQNDEDGALLQTLRCLGGHGGREYFEFGSQTGVEVNTRILRDLYGWRGHLLDGGHADPTIPLHQEFFTPSNIVALLRKYDVSRNLDVLSVDADYDDLYITREILLAGYRPRVLINEYNVNFGSEWSVSTVAKPVGQEERVTWTKDCYFGASALALMRLAEPFGYAPVFSNRVNLIFVRADQARDLGMVLPSAENFPGPWPTQLHLGCSGRTWKVVEAEAMRERATDATLDHIGFAASLPNITLAMTDYKNDREQSLPNWRIFREADTDKGTRLDLD